MKINFKYIILAAGSVFLIFFSFMAFSQDNPLILNDVFEELGISIKGTGEFNIQKNILREGLQNTFWNITAGKNGKVIKIEAIRNIEAKEAKKHIEGKQDVIKSLYVNIPSPYPGMVSKTITCPDEFKPEIIYLKVSDETVPVYLLYSTPRFTYGAGVEELIKYRGALLFIYSPDSKTLYQIELFIPKEEFKSQELLDVLESISLLKTKVVFKNKLVDMAKASLKPRGKTADFKGYNLIIVGFDPLGANHISAYGYFRNTSPNIDQFAKKAVSFSNAVSPSSWTLPVFMSWFTSLYPSQHKIVNKYVSFEKGKDRKSVV